MEKALLPLALCVAAILPPAAQAAVYDNTIDPYVRFLQRQEQTPVDYIMSLFRTYDLVVLCERSHPEVTQYDMICELAADKRFQQQAGHIFVEDGTRTLRPLVESFLMDDTLTESQAQELLRRIFRDFNWGGVSSRTNVYGFLEKVHDLNRSLPKDQRVHVYPSDLDFDWTGATKESYGKLRRQLGRRDQIMADSIVEKFNAIRRSKQGLGHHELPPRLSPPPRTTRPSSRRCPPDWQLTQPPSVRRNRSRNSREAHSGIVPLTPWGHNTGISACFLDGGPSATDNADSELRVCFC